MPRKKMTETEIAAVIGYYLSKKGWDLFPEAVVPGFPGRPDMMGIKQTLVLGVECKTSLTYPVLEQASRWRHHFSECEVSEYVPESRLMIPHLLIVATAANSTRLSGMKADLIRQYRLGYYTVEYEHSAWGGEKNGISDHGTVAWEGHVYRIREEVQPKIQLGARRTAHRLHALLREEMKQGTAGASGATGQYVTPFKITLHRALSVLATKGRVMHMDKVLHIINAELGGHHYVSDGSAKQSLSKFMVEKELVRKDRDHGPWYELTQKGKDLLAQGAAAALSSL